MADTAIEVATTSAIFTGRCAAYEHFARLADALRQLPILVLTECKVLPIWRPTTPIAAGVTCHVPVSHIVWARPLEEPAGAAGDREGSEDDVVQKVPHPLAAIAPPFLIQGSVHLVQGADPTIAFEHLAQGFLAITDAKVVCGGNEATAWDAQFIVLNGLLVEVFSLNESGQAAA
jgi:hypothetical protein